MRRARATSTPYGHMTARGENCAAPTQRVASIPASLVGEMRSGLLRMISDVSLEISLLIEDPANLDVPAYVAKMRRLDLLRALLNKAGITARGTRPAPVELTETDHPTLALKALESEYQNRLSRAEDGESAGFTASTRRLVELGELVAALREWLSAGTDDAP